MSSAGALAGEIERQDGVAADSPCARQRIRRRRAAITQEEQRLAETVGAAALVERQRGVPALVEVVMGKALPHAC